jgi:hypothetical protein
MKDIREETEKRNKRLIVSPLKKEVGDDAKNQRIIGLVHPMSNGEWYMMSSMKDLIAEISSYPGITNDLVDCLAWWDKVYGSGLLREKPGHIKTERNSDFLSGRSEVCGY